MLRKLLVILYLPLFFVLAGCSLGAASAKLPIYREAGDALFAQPIKLNKVKTLPDPIQLQDRLVQQQGDLRLLRVEQASAIYAYRLPKQFVMADAGILRISWARPQALQVLVLDKNDMLIAARQTPAPGGTTGLLVMELELPGGVELSTLVFVTDAFEPGSVFEAPVLSLGGMLTEVRLDSEQAWIPSGLRLRQTGTEKGLYGLDQVAAFKDANWLELVYETPVSLFEGPSSVGPSLIQIPLIITTQAGRKQEYLLRLRPGRNSVYFHTLYLGDALSGISLLDTQNGFSVRALKAGRMPSGTSNVQPLPADLGVLFDYPQSAWRNPDFELFSWNLFPGVLYFDFINYAVQAEFLKRLAFFVEKQGFQGRLLSDAELEGKHGYNAHNYNGLGLAAFYNAADQTGFALNAREELLRTLVIQAGIIKGQAGRYEAGPGGILSITRESPFGPGLLRELLLTHEAMHGVFYESVGFYAFAYDFWRRSMSEEQRSFWQLFMATLNYGPEDEYLMINELQAYMLQYPHRNNNWYYNTLIRQRLTAAMPGQKAFIDSFYKRNPEFFVHASLAFNRALFQYTGLIGGDVRCLVPIKR